VDKIGSDYRGDPSSALLEVLDPRAELFVRDHYLNVPFDCPNVMSSPPPTPSSTDPAGVPDRME